MRVIVSATGASGMPFFVEFLKNTNFEKYVIVSRWARYILKEECGVGLEELSQFYKKEFMIGDLSAPFASGSNHFDANVIIPCSLNTLAKITCGIADNLITRVAEVALKERRKLIICIREAPLSTTAIENMLKLSKLGAIIFPLSPGFYLKPPTLLDAVRLTVYRISSLITGEALDYYKAEEL